MCFAVVLLINLSTIEIQPQSMYRFYISFQKQLVFGKFLPRKSSGTREVEMGLRSILSQPLIKSETFSNPS